MRRIIHLAFFNAICKKQMQGAAWSAKSRTRRSYHVKMAPHREGAICVGVARDGDDDGGDTTSVFEAS